jgi:hypothetical protein
MTAHAYAPHEAISACTKSAEEPKLGAYTQLEVGSYRGSYAAHGLSSLLFAMYIRAAP